MKIVDERVVNARQKINAKAFGYAFIGLWAIMIYRMFLLNQAANEYLDIFILTIVLSVYVVVNNVIGGVFESSKSKRPLWLTVLFEMVFFIAFIFIFKYVTGVDEIIQLLAVGVLVMIIRYAQHILGFISNKIIESKMN